MRKVFFVTSDRIGGGNPELGALLMRNFLYSLARAEARPDVVFFANDGVKLACEGSESLEDLDLLALAGVRVLSCGTCLDYLKLTDALKVGAVGKMPELVGWMADAQDVVTVC